MPVRLGLHAASRELDLVHVAKPERLVRPLNARALRRVAVESWVPFCLQHERLRVPRWSARRGVVQHEGGYALPIELRLHNHLIDECVSACE